MADKNSLAEINATVAIQDLKRRDRLLKIIRGKPHAHWYGFGFGFFWLLLVAYVFKEEAHIIGFLAPVFIIMGTSNADIFRRMDALIEILGEDELRKPKTMDENSNA